MTIQTTLILSALFALLAASLYAYIGWRLGKRVVAASGARLAWQSPRRTGTAAEAAPRGVV